ncbi:MAG TPA: adenine phosphoribosyltransferase [Leeuwenhoekiella sp.]|nr:adenine phosphoribosyltransferase [Leeuwenhoekiella sp.]
MDLKAFIKDVPNFPKQDILFKDISPLLKSNKATRTAIEMLAGPLRDLGADHVVGIESRGFLLGMLLAQELGVGFTPIRKPGKLPGEIIVETYELEYGLDTLEMQQNAIKKGDKVILHDDVLATGGTAMAASNLIRKCGGEILEFNFLLELENLNGRHKLRNVPIRALLNY